MIVISSCQDKNSPGPGTPEDSIYLACVPALSDSSFDIATWNIEKYPATNFQVEQVVDIIETLDADLIALQEIANKVALDELLSQLPGWSGEISVSGSLNVAYIYKTAEVTMTDVTEIYVGMSEPFPRAPAVTTATHINGLSVHLINIHLKCCGGADNTGRREEASRLLKEYIDNDYPGVETIVLGDFNDLIYSANGDPITFQNFLDDPDNYSFADMDIAMGPSGWSYPDWPSHIDHILVTNELFDNLSNTQTLILDDCEAGYITTVSDHRPVMVSLNN
jgi:endonuclease/exonuclease/phosphatase family metal-dependent hydrolase